VRHPRVDDSCSRHGSVIRLLTAAETAARLPSPTLLFATIRRPLCALSPLKCSLAAAEAATCRPLSVEILHASRDSRVLPPLQSACPVLPKQPRAGFSSLCSSTSVRVTFPNSSHLGVNREKLSKQPSAHRSFACRVHKSRAASAAPTKLLCPLSVAETTYR